MKIPKLNNKGISLALTLGVIIILMMAASTIFLLMMRSIRATHGVEASTRALFAAEAGIENALYEISPHYAGYQTPNFTTEDGRSDVFAVNPLWENRWQISSIDADGDFEGRLVSGEKLVLSFFQDRAGDTSIPDNYVSEESATISPIDTSSLFTVSLQIPFDNEGSYSSSFSSQGNQLYIDNDGDLGTVGRTGSQSLGIEGLNEDSASDEADCDGSTVVPDGDCDTREDEDSRENPVVLWKIGDKSGRSLIPIKGCITGTGGADDPAGSELCEKDFSLNVGTGKIEVSLDQDTLGLSNTGDIVSIGDFISPNYNGRGDDEQLKMEFLIASPLIQVDSIGLQKDIPYLEYSIDTRGGSFPLPYFTIDSDGYYQGYKQSLNTQLVPKESVPLLNITIIQEQ